MTRIMTSTATLTNQFTHHKTLKKAGDEALKNAQLLALSGFVTEAYQITSTLLGLTDDIIQTKHQAWQINQQTGFVHEVRHVHQLLCWLLNKPCPSIAREEKLNADELQQDAEERWQDMLAELMMATRMQALPAGQDWNDNYFNDLKKMQPNENGIYKNYGLFSNDLDWLMRYRLRQSYKEDMKSAKFDLGVLEEFLHANIKVSNKALDYDIRSLVETLAECNQKLMQQTNSDELGYMEVNIFQSMLIIDLLENNIKSAKKQLSHLLASDNLYHDVSQLLYFPQFQALAQQGAFADSLHIDKSAVDSYLAEFYSRTNLSNTNHSKGKPSKPQPQTQPHYANLADLTTILKNSTNQLGKDLLNLPLQEISIPTETNSIVEKETLLAIRFPAKANKPRKKQKSWKNLLGKKNKDTANTQKLATKATEPRTEADWQAIWHFAHSLMAKTNRYPVLVMDWGLIEGDDWADLLDRGIYAHEEFDGDRIGISANELIQGAENIDLAESLKAIANTYTPSLEEFFEYETGIDDDDVIAELSEGLEDADGNIDYLTLAKRTFLWEVKQTGKPNSYAEHLTWFLPSEKDEVYLLLLPTKNPWEVPSYLHFYGAESYGSEVLIAQLKQWHKKYGLQISWSLGTMLNITVDNRPNTDEEAVELAYIQHLLAPSTYAPSGFNMGEYAMTLMDSDKWFLHERP